MNFQKWELFSGSPGIISIITQLLRRFTMSTWNELKIPQEVHASTLGITLKDMSSTFEGFLIKITLLSAPVSRELPFCKTTLPRKHLISPILFGQSKIGKKDVVLHGLGNREICKSQCFR